MVLKLKLNHSQPKNLSSQTKLSPLASRLDRRGRRLRGTCTSRHPYPSPHSAHQLCPTHSDYADAKPPSPKKARPGGGDVVAADAMDVGGGRAVGAGRGDAGDDGGDGAPRPGGPFAAGHLPGAPRHPPQAARLLPPVHGVPFRPQLLRRR